MIEDTIENGECELCGKYEEDFFNHKSSEQHKFEFYLWEWNQYKKAIVKNRQGVEVEINVDKSKPYIVNIHKHERKGKFIVTILQKDFKSLSGIEFDFTVKNIKKDGSVLLKKANILHILESFAMEDPMNILSNGHLAELEPEAKYRMKVRFDEYGEGLYQMAVGFLFQVNNSEFTIARELVINIVTEHDDCVIQEKIKSPFTNQQWIVSKIIPASNHKPDLRFTVPKELQLILSYGLKNNSVFIDEQLHMTVWKTIKHGCNYNTYTSFFHYLLWMDELGTNVKLQRYNLENVPFKFDKNCIQIEVPGLAEKRPSIMKEDEVKIRIHDSNIAYLGVIDKILESSILISKVQDEFIQKLRLDPSLMLDVSFSTSRLSYIRMHQAIFSYENVNKDFFFPTATPSNVEGREIHVFYNHQVRTNLEQRKAVTNIVFRSSGSSPFIVFGPPGTGKTITICEAIIQIAMRDRRSKILICAPSNAACDMLTEKLSEHFSNEQLIRIHSTNVDWRTVPERIKKFSNRDGSAVKRISAYELNKYQIVVTTLILIGRYHGEFERSHIFIDEAAQATEPETAIAVCGILQENGQLILAGDHKQLGPVINSKPAKEYGLGLSLLTRLIQNYPQYAPYPQNSNYIVKLKINYRSHPRIIELPNKLFYDEELVPVSQEAINDPINKIVLPVDTRSNVRPCAVEFYATSGKDEKDGASPSYFNQHEVLIVIKYVQELLRHPIKVCPDEIGIITPYKRQIHKIKVALDKKNIEGIEVGSVETFQGREKRIIIISTVRGKEDLLLEDCKYDMGFVANEPRFNVALTRAKSKLIIVGNPTVLSYARETWSVLMQFCKELGSFRGCNYVERNSKNKRLILDKLSIIHVKDDQY